MRLLRLLLALGFVTSGVLHFVRPRGFEAIVPPALPNPALLVQVSGVAEVLGGVGLLVPAVRPAAAAGLMLLLVAVFPANVYMATNADDIRGMDVPQWALWARLPLQPLLIWLVWRAGWRAARPTSPRE